MTASTNGTMWPPQYSTSMSLSLEDQVSARLAENHFPLGWKQRYMPWRRLDGLVTRSSIIREFSKDYALDEHHRSQVRIDEGLINFIVNSAQKLLAISLISGIESFRLHKVMDIFWKSNYTDNELPVTPQDIRFPWSQLKWGAIKVESFIENQWKFLVRIFDHSGSKLHVGNQEVLPFRLVDHQRKGGTFSDVWRVEIHEEQQKQPMQMFDGSGRLATAAIKALKLSADHHGSEAAGLWEREAKALEDINGLRHKHIIEMKAIITWEGKGNYVMFQWADGGSLRDFYERSPRPTLKATFVKQVLWQLVGLSSALNKLHNYKKHDKDNGSYRHGDLKPENILRFNNGTEVGLLKISDLGLAKHHVFDTGKRGPTVTRHGTPLYEPPEVILVEPQIARSRQYDIWSMGCVLLELLVWLMYGYGELVRFNNSMNSALGNSSVYWVMEETDGRSRSASVHPSVMICMDIMGKDLERAGQTAISDLLWLIRNRLLVVRLPRMTNSSSFGQSNGSLPAPPDCRAKAADLEGHMQGILNRAQLDDKYASTNVQAYNLVNRIEAVKYGIIMPSRFSMNVPVVRRQEVSTSHCLLEGIGDRMLESGLVFYLSYGCGRNFSHLATEINPLTCPIRPLRSKVDIDLN